jgi:hypothetical protein
MGATSPARTHGPTEALPLILLEPSILFLGSQTLDKWHMAFPLEGNYVPFHAAGSALESSGLWKFLLSWLDVG